MRDNIPTELLVFTGENDVELDESCRGIFLTPILNKLTTSKAVIKNRLGKLSNYYGSEVGDIKPVVIKNSDFILEIPTIEENGASNYDSVTLIIHHPDLEERKNYKTAVQIDRYRFLNLLFKIRNISSTGKFAGKFRVEYNYDCLNFIPDIDVIEDEEVRRKIELGKILANESNWTKTLIPGHWYILKERYNSMSRSIYLGTFNCIYSPRFYDLEFRSPFSNDEALSREDYMVFLNSGYYYDSTDLSTVPFKNIGELISFGYLGSRKPEEMKKRPGVDMGEIIVGDDNLSEFLENKTSEFWDSYLGDNLDHINTIPAEEIRLRKNKFIEILKNEKKKGNIKISIRDMKNRLVNLFGFTSKESDEIIEKVM